jgi:hypothetical protein
VRPDFRRATRWQRNNQTEVEPIFNYVLSFSGGQKTKQLGCEMISARDRGVNSISAGRLCAA